MKITQSPQFSDKITKGSQYGIIQYASFSRIIDAMVKAGEMCLASNEKIVGIEIDNNGLSFVTDQK